MWIIGVFVVAKKSYAFLFLWQPVTHVSVPFPPDINLHISNISSSDASAESLQVFALQEMLLLKLDAMFHILNLYEIFLRFQNFPAWTFPLKKGGKHDICSPYYCSEFETFNSCKEILGFGWIKPRIYQTTDIWVSFLPRTFQRNCTYKHMKY